MPRCTPIFLTLALIASLTTLSVQEASAARQRLGIAAVVNDDVVTLADVDNRVKMYVSAAPSPPPASARAQLEQQILDRLIDEKLQMQEAKDLGITVGEQQVSEAFAAVARQNGLPPDEFRKRLSSAGVSLSTLHDQLRADIAWSQVIRRKLRPQVNISESEIDSAIDQIARSGGKDEFRVAEIFLAVKSPAEEQGVRKEAEKIIKQLTSGASFSSVARAMSQAPGAATGGDLGWVTEGQLDPALDKALGKMQTGQISPPLRTDKGFHILFLRDARLKGIAAAEPAAAPAVQAPPQEDAGPVLHLKQIVIPVSAQDPAPVVAAKTMRAQTLKDEISSCADMDAKMKDFTSPGTGDMGKGPLKSLPPPLRDAVETLPVGTLSAPVRADNGIAVLMVCAREEVPAQKTETPAKTAGFAAPAVPDKGDEKAREEIANKLGMQRLDQMQSRYLRDLRASAYIDKRL